jgi:hypothetical protein
LVAGGAIFQEVKLDINNFGEDVVLEELCCTTGVPAPDGKFPRYHLVGGH